jgi:CRP-like cAMP-binding protein
MTGLDDDPFAEALVLGGLEASDRTFLAERSRQRRLDKGQILFLEGDASDSVLVLVSGHMKVVTYSTDGDELTLNTVLPGDTIGEIGVLSGSPRSATVQATQASVVLSLPGTVLVDLISKRPVLALALLGRLSQLVRRATGLASDLVFLDMRQRVAKYILQLDREDTRSVGLRVTQSDLAASIGASRQRVNACLRDFHKEGWICLERRGLHVLDRDALTRVVTL